MIRITTTSGTVYELDTDLQRVQRLPAVGAAVLHNDGREHRYHAIINGPTIGESFVYTHGFETRVTTPVTAVETVTPQR